MLYMHVSTLRLVIKIIFLHSLPFIFFTHPCIFPTFHIHQVQVLNCARKIVLFFLVQLLEIGAKRLDSGKGFLLDYFGKLEPDTFLRYGDLSLTALFVERRNFIRKAVVKHYRFRTPLYFKSISRPGLPKQFSGKQSACQADVGSTPAVGRFPWRRKWQSTPIFLTGKSHGQRSLVGYSPWGHKLSDMTD